MSNYWASTLSQRITRRRALAATGGLTAAAAFLAACGGSDSGGSSGESSSSLITKPVDTTSQAKRGGTLKWYAPAEPANLDVQVDQAPKNVLKNMTYGHFVGEKPGLLKGPAYEEYIPEMMESWEWSQDGLQLTFKMRQGVKWHNKAPVNGRFMDAEDITFSWDRFAAKGTDRRFLSNAANPDAPVLSVTATDANTIVFKLKEPVVFLLAALTPSQTGKPNIVPKETDSTFDIRSDMIGTGPFQLSGYQPTVGFNFKRNPDYFDKTYPLIDNIEMPLVLEYSQALAQLKAGNIHTYSGASSTSLVRGEDIIAVKRDTPDLQIYQNQPTGFTVRAIVFGWTPTEANKPFKDERVRQAASMSWDRDSYVDAFYNVTGFKNEGLPVDTYWNTHLFSGAGAWWLDPKDSKFGPNAQYLQYNIAEAKKLLSAAGYPNGVEVSSSYIGGTQLGADAQRQVGVTDTFAADAGFRVKPNVIDYTAEYIPVIRDGNGKFEGWAYRAGGSPANDAVAYFSTLFHSKYGGPGFLGFDSAGKGDGSGDPEFEAILNKARGERDTARRRELVNDMQKHLVKKMYAIPHEPGQASNFLMAWPAVQNFQVFQGDRRTVTYGFWIDETKAPYTKS